MAAPTLIYCASGNKRYAEIAIHAGFQYGAQLPHTIYYPPYFVDQDWRNPNRERYMAALVQYKPYMASVLDWERPEQLPEVLSWAEEAAQYVEIVMIIPKVQGGVKLLPYVIGGKPIRLGYSVPTGYGGTELVLSEFTGWPIHLLGGSPKRQFEIAQYLTVTSVDGNSSTKAAEYGNYWDGKQWRDVGDCDDMPYVAFEKSCLGIVKMWNKG